MAPEQLSSGVADARSDQFAFCVSLYEALYGRRPFLGDTAEALAKAMREEVQPATPTRGRVPAWLSRVLSRGLQRDPNARFETLAPIIAAIDPHRRRQSRRRRWLVGGGLVALGAVALAARVTAQPPETTEAAADPCPRQALPDDVWGDARRDAMSARVREAIEADYATDLATALATQLDAYAGAWTDAHQTACADTYVRRTQSEAQFDLRMRCLERRSAKLDALVDRLVAADAKLAGKAPQLVAELPPLSECADEERLASAFARPDDPATAAVVASVEEILDRVEADVWAGAFEDASAGLHQADETLGEVDWPVVEAQAAFLRGKLFKADGKPDDAERALLDATAAGESVSADRLVARAWILLVTYTATESTDTKTSAFYGERATAAVRRIGSPPEIASLLHQALANQRIAKGEFDAAIEQLHTARTAAQDDAVHPRTTASIVTDLGRAHFYRGEYDAAAEQFGEALKVWANLYGPGHPHVASVISNLGSAELLAGRRADARKHLLAAYEAQVKIYGDRHAKLKNTLNALASIDYVEGQFEDALPRYEALLEIVQSAKGPDSVDLVEPLSNIGRCLAQMGRVDEALIPAQRGVDIARKALGEDHPRFADALAGLGNAQNAAGRSEAALRSHLRALEIRETALGSDSVKAAESGVTVGDLYRTLGRRAEARMAIERWLPILEEKLGPTHPHSCHPKVTLGWLELDAGRTKKAAKLFRAADEGLTDDTPAARVLLNLGLGMSTWDDDREAARAKLEQVAGLSDPRFATMAGDARAFLDEHAGDTLP